MVALTRLNSSGLSLQSSQYWPAVDSVYTLPKRSTAHSTELGMAAAARGQLEAGGWVSVRRQPPALEPRARFPCLLLLAL